jgi:hypothetical protein
MFLGPDGTVVAEVAVIGGHVLTGLTTDLLDGGVVETSNVQVMVFAPPPGFDVEALPFEMPLDDLLRRHGERIAAQAHSGTRPRVLAATEVAEADRDRARRFHAHRVSVGYLTRDEMASMMGKPQREQLLEPLWREFRRLVDAHKAQRP